MSNAFGQCGFRWLAMKGPVLSMRYYPRPADRSFRDLDLLVDRRDLGAASDVLAGLGFRHVISNWPLARTMLAGEIDLVSPSACIDLHWHLGYSEIDRRRMAIDPNELLSRRRHIDLAGLTVPTFDAEGTDVTLAYHAARTGGHRLVWMKDLEHVLRVDAPDLDIVVRRAQEARVGPQVGLMLDRTRAITGIDVPSEVIEALVPRSLRFAERMMRKRIDPVHLHERNTPYRSRCARSGHQRSTRSNMCHRVLRDTCGGHSGRRQ